MKIKFKIAAMLAAVALFSITSCNKTPDAPAVSDETGVLKITLELPNDAPSETRAAASTARPITTWAKSIKTVMVIFANTSGVVLDARTITPSTATDATAKEYTLTNVTAGVAYDIFVVANYDQAGFNYASPNPAWTIANVKGKNISALPLTLAASSTYAARPTETGHTAYSSPAEFFVGTQRNITVTADQTNPTAIAFTLTRAVSMFRTRIISLAAANPPSMPVGNSSVAFGDANADIRIRRIANEVKLQTPASPADNVVFAPGTKVGTQLVYSKGAMSATNPVAADYTNPTTMLGTGGTAHKFWKDILILPGGHATTNSQMFEVVISGLAPVGYIPIDVTTNQPAAALTAPALVYWAGIVEQQAISRNQILEVDLTINSAGYNNPPQPGTTGNLKITISLADWGTIVNADITM